MDFKDWIIKEKGYGDKSASDVISRVKRAQKLCEKEDFSNSDLEESKEFLSLSLTVKSQIRNAVRIRDAYNNVK